ncbi:MAG: hypothetical protein KatS3mg101_0331 [Patescibacteria group bacterium]|nr:MAG: hypothetical protein KatS3mg101_0331 [Patescibacteria group bacterium]
MFLTPLFLLFLLALGLFYWLYKVISCGRYIKLGELLETGILSLMILLYLGRLMEGNAYKFVMSILLFWLVFRIVSGVSWLISYIMLALLLLLSLVSTLLGSVASSENIALLYLFVLFSYCFKLYTNLKKTDNL